MTASYVLPSILPNGIEGLGEQDSLRLSNQIRAKYVCPVRRIQIGHINMELTNRGVIRWGVSSRRGSTPRHSPSPGEHRQPSNISKNAREPRSAIAADREERCPEVPHRVKQKHPSMGLCDS